MATRFGPMARITLETSDVQRPGAPGLTAEQIDNTTVAGTLTPSGTDADGSPLTGLVEGVVGTVTMEGGIDPTADLTMDEALALPGVQQVSVALSPDQAGQPQPWRLPALAPGRQQIFFAACADSAAAPTP